MATTIDIKTDRHPNGIEVSVVANAIGYTIEEMGRCPDDITIPAERVALYELAARRAIEALEVTRGL